MSSSDSSSQDTISSPNEMPGETENMSDGIKEPFDDGSNEASDESNEASEVSINKVFDDLLKEHLLKGLNDKKMDNVVAKLIERKKLNTMVIRLCDYKTGFVISFNKYGEDEEITHGVYSYGVSVLDYIKDGEIPYELFDVIYNYDFKLFYDGYIACELRIDINGTEGIPSNIFGNEDAPSALDEKEGVPSTLDEKDEPSNFDEKEGVPSNLNVQTSVLSYSDEQDVEPPTPDQDVEPPTPDDQDVELPSADEQDVEQSEFDEQEDEPSYFDLKGGIRSYYVLLKHSIQTIDGECCMKMKKDQRDGEISSVEYDKERAKLIHHYSPDLCLDPDPVAAEILISNGLKQHSFITPHLKRVIQNEKEQIELMLKNSANQPESVPTKLEDDKNWNFRLKEPAEEEAKFTKLGSGSVSKLQVLSSYLKLRKICFPDKDSFTGSHVEIENFVFEYEGITRTRELADDIVDKLIISVIDETEQFYITYQLDERMKNNAPSLCWSVGDRESLDMHLQALSKAEESLCCGLMKVTHNRMFDEIVEYSDETVQLHEGESINARKVKITRRKFEVPVSKVALVKRLPPPDPDMFRKPLD